MSSSPSGNGRSEGEVTVLTARQRHLLDKVRNLMLFIAWILSREVFFRFLNDSRRCGGVPATCFQQATMGMGMGCIFWPYTGI